MIDAEYTYRDLPDSLFIELIKHITNPIMFIHDKDGWSMEKLVLKDSTRLVQSTRYDISDENAELLQYYIKANFFARQLPNDEKASYAQSGDVQIYSVNLRKQDSTFVFDLDDWNGFLKLYHKIIKDSTLSVSRNFDLKEGG